MRLYMLLPRSSLRNYLAKNYMSIDPEGFIAICDRLGTVEMRYVLQNPAFLSSPLVRDYIGSKRSVDEIMDSVLTVPRENISEELVDFAESLLDKKPEVSYLDPQYYSSKKICLYMLDNNSYYGPSITDGLLTLDHLDDDILARLKGHALSPKLFAKFPELLEDVETFKKSVLDDHSLLELQSDDFFVRNPLLVEELKYFIFNEKPSLIKHLNNNQLFRYESYIPEDYVPTEEDLMNHPALTNSSYIMKRAIHNDPRMLLYLGGDGMLYRLLEGIDVEEVITPEDLENHPTIIRSLRNIYPHPFPLYCLNYGDQEQKRQMIYEHILDHKIDDLIRLPFMREKFDAPLPEDDVAKLLKRLDDTDVDYDDIVQRKQMFENLNKIIYGVILIRYNKIKNSKGFLYNNQLDIKEDVVGVFQDFSPESLQKLAVKIQGFDNNYTVEQIEDELKRLYEIYKAKGDIPKEDSEPFFKSIMDHHQDYFFKIQQAEIIRSIIIGPNTKLSEEEVRKQLFTYKLQKITAAFKNERYDLLGVTEEDVEELLRQKDNAIINNKKFKKAHIEIPDDMFRRFHFFFLGGDLSPSMICFLLKLDPNDAVNLEMAKLIIQNYEKVKLQFFDKVDTESFHVTWGNVPFTPNAIQLCSREHTVDVLTNLILHLNKERLQLIMENQGSLEAIKALIPLVGLIPEFSVETLANILAFNDRIVDNSPGIVDTENKGYNNTYRLIKLANGYASCDDLFTYSLGEETANKLGYNPSDYLEVYLQMIQRQKSLIPPVHIETDRFTYESGNCFDSERLLIGVRYGSNSCIDLHNGAGLATYNKCLLEEDGDVIIVRNKNGEFFTRMLVFRVGNVIQIHDKSGMLTQQDLEEIGRSMIEEARKKGDNIEYVLAPTYHKESADFSDYRFVSLFPHADLLFNVRILASNNNGEIDFDYEPHVRYDLPRPRINPYPTENDISRIRALRVEMEPDQDTRENLRREFKPFVKEDYDMVIAGIDWYVARRKDGELESVCLPIEIAREEMELALQEVKGKQR